jgi:hypothetical protein
MCISYLYVLLCAHCIQMNANAHIPRHRVAWSLVGWSCRFIVTYRSYSRLEAHSIRWGSESPQIMEFRWSEFFAFEHYQWTLSTTGSAVSSPFSTLTGDRQGTLATVKLKWCRLSSSVQSELSGLL